MIYEYHCEACDKVIDIEMSLKVMQSNPEILCPDCAQKMHRQISSNCTFMLKGEGWAKDGYSSSKGTSESK
jgi:putative FmdB family regulatory protein